jgi:glutathionyl-hydroquinone reductase
MRSEVVVIVECAALTEWEHQKADFCVHTTMLRHSGSFVKHTKCKRKKKHLRKCEN